MILNDAQITAMSTSGNDLIAPFDREHLSNCSYLLHAESVFAPETGQEIKIEDTSSQRIWTINPGEAVVVLIEEKVHLTATVLGMYTQLNRWAAKGLSLMNASLVEPYYNGPLSCQLVNFSKEPVRLQRGAEIAKLTFHTLEQPPERPHVEEMPRLRYRKRLGGVRIATSHVVPEYRGDSYRSQGSRSARSERCGESNSAKRVRLLRHSARRSNDSAVVFRHVRETHRLHDRREHARGFRTSGRAKARRRHGAIRALEQAGGRDLVEARCGISSTRRERRSHPTAPNGGSYTTEQAMTVALSSNTAEAYDLCARGYREWRWSALWDKVEVPQVARRIRRGPGRVIDLGCGYGRYAALCAGAGFEYTGVDASKSMLLAASPQHGSFVNADLFDYDADTPADVVLCTRVLSNVRDAAAALHAVYRNLRPGGAFVLTDFAESYPFSRQTISIGSGDDVAVPVFRHSTRDLKSAIGKAGLTLESESVLHREAGRPVLKMYYGTRAHPKAIRMADRATASWASRPEAAPGS